MNNSYRLSAKNDAPKFFGCRIWSMPEVRS